MLVGLALIRIIPPFESLPATDEPQSPMLAQRNGYARASENGGDEELGGSRGSATPNYTRRRSSSDIGARAYVPNAELSISSDDEELDGSHGATEDQDVDQGPSFRRDAERQRLLGNGETVKDGRGHGKGSDASADVTGWRLVGQVDFLLLFSVMTFGEFECRMLLCKSWNPLRRDFLSLFVPSERRRSAIDQQRRHDHSYALRLQQSASSDRAP